MDTADRLVGKLRQVAPVRVRVVNASDEAYDVAVPNKRKRWSQVCETIESRPWVRAELLDKHGAVLGFVENESGPATEIEDLGMTAAGGRMGDIRMVLELILRAQREALSFRDKEHAALLQSIVEFMRVNMDNTRELTVLMREQREVAAETAAMRAAAVPQREDGSLDVDELVKLLKASPKILQEVAPVVGPLIMRLLPSPAPQRPPPAPAPAAPSSPAPAPAPPAAPSSPARPPRRRTK